MVQFIPPPEPRALLPPLLACLPTAFASPRPPPALLPILSPILRQRVQLLTAASTSESWLPLLCWDKERAGKLPKLVESMQIEPHPVSGEIELGDVDSIRYRRRDEETLEARLELQDFELLPIYLWCMTDQASGGPGWRLTELRALQDMDDGTEWFDSMDEATEASKAAYIRDALRGSDPPALDGANGDGTEPHHHRQQEEDDDDDYWNSYDRTPGRTPAKRSPAPRPGSNVQMPSASELEYFARYAAEVQPAMDPHDPSEEGLAPGESTLDGNTRIDGLRVEPLATSNHNGPAGSLPPQQPQADGGQESPFEQPTNGELNHPRPDSAASSLSGSVERMERAATAQAQAEVGIKQHISTDIKSLFRLARSAGIQRHEFERIVKTELEMLSMMEADD